MEFRTFVDTEKYKEKIDYSKKIMFIGSCFSENIGQKFEDNFFDVDINPFGVIYNPESVLESLNRLVDRKLFAEEELFFDNEQWHSYGHHSCFSDENKNVALKKINNRLERASDFLQSADYLFITFGTAWVYLLLETGKVVANCHKQQSSVFERRRLEVEQIVQKYLVFLQKLKSFNNNINVVFTVSPVRHWKDGAVENQISKSVLILTISQIVEQLDFVTYFPSFEIVLDELRDYRFYSADMVHVSDLAVDYIWQRIGESFFSEKTLQDLAKVEKIKKALLHRPFNQKSKEYVLFLKKTLQKIENLKKENEHIKLNEATKQIKIKLASYL